MTRSLPAMTLEASWLSMLANGDEKGHQLAFAIDQMKILLVHFHR